MKKGIKSFVASTVTVIVLLVMALSMVACSKPVSYKFAYTYVPQTETVSPFTVELFLYKDGTFELTPGVIIELSDDGKTIRGDGKATGSWEIDDSERLLFTITSASDPSVKSSYIVEKIDNTYEFEINILASNYRRKYPMKLQ